MNRGSATAVLPRSRGYCTKRFPTRPKDADGAVTAVAERWEGKRLNRPNDVVGRSDGNHYFTNSVGRIEAAEREIDFSGVHRVSPGGAVTGATGELLYPNGLAFSPDETVMYGAITRRDDGCLQEKERGEVCTHQSIRAFDLTDDGSLSSERLFANMHSAEDGVPDGMKVDGQGRVYCTGPGGC